MLSLSGCEDPLEIGHLVGAQNIFVSPGPWLVYGNLLGNIMSNRGASS